MQDCITRAVGRCEAETPRHDVSTCDIEEDVPELSRVAIQVILSAGDGKVCAENALKALHAFDFNRADVLIREAEENIVRAHEHQTAIVQREAAGEKFENSIIFNHAQDTLMTAMTQINLSKEICSLFKLLYERCTPTTQDDHDA